MVPYISLQIIAQRVRGPWSFAQGAKIQLKTQAGKLIREGTVRPQDAKFIFEDLPVNIPVWAWVTYLNMPAKRFGLLQQGREVPWPNQRADRRHAKLTIWLP